MRKNFTIRHFLYVCLFLYIVFVCVSLRGFASRMNYILEYPALVSQETREMKTRALALQSTMPGYLSTPTLSMEDYKEIFKRQDDAQDASLAKVAALFRGDPSAIEVAKAALAKLRAARLTAARRLIGNSDLRKARDVYNVVIEPEVKKVYDALNALIASSTALIKKNQEETSRSANINIIIAIAVGAVLLYAFWRFGRSEKLKTDLIERRERLFDALTRNVDDIFIVARGPYSFEFMSDNSARLMGLNPEEILRSPESLYAYLPGEVGDWLASALGRVDELKGLEEKEALIEQSGRVFEISVYPIDSASDGGSGAIVTLRDKTREYHHQVALREALEKANAASDAKSNFLSHMSHEIRTPMNAIIGMTTIALSKLDDRARVEDCLLKIAESSRHLLGLINDVLDMSKIENGKLAISNESFSLPQCVQNINDLIRPQALARGINFDIYQRADVETLKGDALRLNQILINILSNALKFTPAGGNIALRIQQALKNDATVVLRFAISDTGIGMSEEFKSRLFQPFEQASNRITARYGGTGLGMSITRNLASLMGGKIEVESEEGKGSTFIVELPFEYADEDALAQKSLPEMRILVIDDDLGTCEHAKLLLEKMGMEVEWALSGQAGIDMIVQAQDEGRQYDVCFVDWKMPDMDGAETARRIRRIVSEDMLIIIISAYDWSSIEERARADGINDFIAKPFFASSLYDALLASTRKTSPVRKRAEAAEEPASFAGKRALLVEDNEFNREIAREFLAMADIEADDAENGRVAVEKFAASAPGYYDIIFMDVQMPVMDGYEATQAIRASGHPDAATILIVAMTANAFSEDVRSALRAGMNDHIAKPIDIKELFKKFAKFLGAANKGGDERDG